MEVVSDIICPFAQRVIGVLELKGVDYEIERISLGDKPDWFLKASPNAQVPILIEDRGVLFESSPICEYLDEVYCEPRLHPQDPFKRAQHRAWVELAAKNYLVQCPTMRSPTVEIFEERKAKLLTAFEKIEKVLAEGPYFDGSRLSMVDPAWHPLLYRAALVEKHTGFDFLSAFPKAKTWQQELMKVDALARSVSSEDFEKAFVGFYLNDQTYLGRLMGEKAA